MFMCKQMLLAVFKIAVALGAEAELQVGIIILRLSAHGAFMLCHLGSPPDILPELHPPLHLPGRHVNMVSGTEEKDNKIQQRGDNGNPDFHTGHKNKVIQQHQAVENSHPSHFHRDKEHQKHLHIRECGGKSQENGHIDIISVKQSGVLLKHLPYHHRADAAAAI